MTAKFAFCKLLLAKNLLVCFNSFAKKIMSAAGQNCNDICFDDL